MCQVLAWLHFCLSKILLFQMIAKLPSSYNMIRNYFNRIWRKTVTWYSPNTHAMSFTTLSVNIHSMMVLLCQQVYVIMAVCNYHSANKHYHWSIMVDRDDSHIHTSHQGTIRQSLLSVRTCTVVDWHLVLSYSCFVRFKEQFTTLSRLDNVVFIPERTDV